jgi:hypothetical protein
MFQGQVISIYVAAKAGRRQHTLLDGGYFALRRAACPKNK